MNLPEVGVSLPAGDISDKVWIYRAHSGVELSEASGKPLVMLYWSAGRTVGVTVELDLLQAAALVAMINEVVKEYRHKGVIEALENGEYEIGGLDQ